MPILLDNIIYSLQNVGGISTYWFELSKRFIRDNYNVIFIENQKNKNYSLRKISKYKRKIILVGKYSFLLTRFLNVGLKPTRDKFIFHSSYYRINSCNNAINVVTIHDFIHEIYYSGIRRFLHIFLKKRAMKSADAIITVSNNTKKDLLKLYPEIDSNKVRVIYNGVSDDFYLLDKDKNFSNYFLFVGSREFYKNFDFIVEELSKLSDMDFYIVGGKLSTKESVLLNNKLLGRWRLFTNVSNVDLNFLYNNAFALLYLSSYEGFGIPLLEAMRTGCPFIALNKSSIPEVAGNAGVLINSLESHIFLNAVNEVKENRDVIIERGLSQSLNFSWEKCFSQTIELYNDLLI
jgi:glycosyltransferase involved in cell wall biosynthesis